MNYGKFKKEILLDRGWSFIEDDFYPALSPVSSQTSALESSLCILITKEGEMYLGYSYKRDYGVYLEWYEFRTDKLLIADEIVCWKEAY